MANASTSTSIPSAPAPERYTHGHHESVLRSHTWRTVENSASYLIGELVPGKTVLDIGCGPGTITADFARRVAPGRVTGLDASGEVVVKAAQHACDQGLDNVDFVVGDAYGLEFADGTFDVVHAHQTLQHLADPVQALKEMCRVTKPGGVVAARDADYSAMFWFPAIAGLDEWMSVYQAVHRGNGGDPDAGRSIRDWALQAGFTDIACTGSMWAYGTDAERTWWGGLWADRVLHSAFGPQAIALGVADQTDLQRIAGAWKQWADTPNAWFGVPHGELLARKPQAT